MIERQYPIHLRRIGEPVIADYLESMVIEIDTHEKMFLELCELRRERDALKAAIIRPDWISVEERLPEDDLPEGSEVKLIKVLVAIKAKNGVTVRTQTRHRRTLFDTRREPFFNWEWRYSAGKVTHWMPLPEPPEVRFDALD